MSLTRSTFFKWAAAGVVAAGALFAATSASARSDVSWSVGVGLPGVAVGVGGPAYYPAPVYAPPAPVYYAPPAPVYYNPPPGVLPSGPGLLRPAGLLRSPLLRRWLLPRWSPSWPLALNCHAIRD
jgi:hypothetical protein